MKLSLLTKLSTSLVFRLKGAYSYSFSFKPTAGNPVGWMREDNPNAESPGTARSKANMKLILFGLSSTKEQLFSRKGTWEPVGRLQKSWDWTEPRLPKGFPLLHFWIETVYFNINLRWWLLCWFLELCCPCPSLLVLIRELNWMRSSDLLLWPERFFYMGRAVLFVEATCSLPRWPICPVKGSTMGLWGGSSPGLSSWNREGHKTKSRTREQRYLGAVLETVASPICSLLLSPPHAYCW